jgi:hypothetical protein
MLYNIFFGFYENIVNRIQNTIDNYFKNKPEESLVEKNYFLLIEHIFFSILGVNFFWNEYWLWDITQMWKSELSYYIFIYYYLYISRYVVQIKMLTGTEKDYKSSLIHHISTISLLAFSFLNYHRIGIIIGIVHDISDIFLLFSKNFHKTYEVNKKGYLNILSYIFFFLFSVIFFFTRIIINSKIINYIFQEEIFKYKRISEFYNNSLIFKSIDAFICVIFLLLNLGLQIFWQLMIIKFSYNLILGNTPKDEKDNTYFKKKEIKNE